MVTCEFENGNKASLRHVTVGVIALNDDNQVLLVKRAPHLTRPNTYTVPGGYVDRDEDTKEAALRELKEETGYIGEIQMLFQINDSPNRPKEDRQNIDFTYIAKIIGGAPKDNKEVTDIQWFELSSLPSEDEFAFDHRASILKYLEYLENSFKLPIIGKI